MSKSQQSNIGTSLRVVGVLRQTQVKGKLWLVANPAVALSTDAHEVGLVKY